MSEARNEDRGVLTESVMLSRLQKSDEMREFFIEMWKQNPTLAKQGGARVQNLLSAVDSKQRGISLIELIIFIVIISVALTGILLVMNQTTAHSADPMIRKQALAIAESILEEVELMPFTYCDPDDASAVTATSTADCTTVEVMGVENDVSRNDTALPFDNVSDYHGYDSVAEGGIKDITGAPIAAGYSATVSVAEQSIGTIPAVDSLLITVTVDAPGGEQVVMDGVRTRYSPRSLP